MMQYRKMELITKPIPSSDWSLQPEIMKEES